MAARNHVVLIKVQTMCRTGSTDPFLAEVVEVRKALSWIEE